jgi:hypothetical protein
MATAVEWAAAEGWNPGLNDAACFRETDPDGFLVGTLEGAPVTSISMVRYDESFAFLGFYIARPDARGRGLGYATWTAGMALAGDRVIGLDGVPDQQENYAAEGFTFAHRNQRFGGVPAQMPDAAPAGVEIVEAGAVDRAALAAYDRAGFPADRRGFLDRWLTSPGHVAKAAVGPDGRLAGFAALRPCREGAKIAPVMADDRPTAEALIAGLLRQRPEGPVYLDPPGANPDAVAIARNLGLAPVFETARMYRGAHPDLDLARVFAITSFELG